MPLATILRTALIAKSQRISTIDGPLTLPLFSARNSGAPDVSRSEVWPAERRDRRCQAQRSATYVCTLDNRSLACEKPTRLSRVEALWEVLATAVPEAASPFAEQDPSPPRVLVLSAA